jgi:hypothetical protein
LFVTRLICSTSQVPYGNLSFADYQQRRQQLAQQQQQYPASGSYPPPLPAPYTPYTAGAVPDNRNDSAAAFQGQRSRGGSLSLPVPPLPISQQQQSSQQQAYLTDAARDSIAEVDRVMQGSNSHVPSQHQAQETRSQRGDSVHLQDGQQRQRLPSTASDTYGAYDAYHSSSLRTNSLEIAEHDGAAAAGLQNPFTTAYYATDEEVPTSGEEGPHSAAYYRNYGVGGGAGSSAAPNAGTGAAVHSSSGRADYSQLYSAATASDFGQQQLTHPSRTSQRAPSGASTPSSAAGGSKKEKNKGPDKAQLALFMHGDVKANPANWHSSLRR